MTNNLQERRSVAAGQVDAMLDTLSETKVQKITELFDKTVIQENLDETSLTEEWEGYHDWLAIRTGAAYAPLSQPGHGKHKLDSSEAASEEDKVEADLEAESTASYDEPAETTVADVLAPVPDVVEDSADDADAGEAEVESEAPVADDEEPEAPVVDEEPQSFFSSDDDDDDADLEGEVAEAPVQQSVAGRITVNDVLQKDFTIEKLRGGYNEDDVDYFLDKIAAFLNESHTNAELDAKIAEVESHGFRRKKLGSGCNVGEVDAFLDEIVEELKARKN